MLCIGKEHDRFLDGRTDWGNVDILLKFGKNFGGIISFGWRILFHKSKERLVNLGEFSFGKKQTSWRFIDGDGIDEYTPKSIVTFSDPNNLKLNKELSRIKTALIHENRNKILSQFTGSNDLRYYLDKFIVRRSKLDKHLMLDLFFGQTDHLTF